MFDQVPVLIINLPPMGVEETVAEAFARRQEELRRIADAEPIRAAIRKQLAEAAEAAK